MKFIYPITDPEILKLGFGSMALYRDPMPEGEFFTATKRGKELFTSWF